MTVLPHTSYEEIDAIVDGFSVGDAVTNLHFLGWDDGPPPGGLGPGLGALDACPRRRSATAPRRTIDSQEATTTSSLVSARAGPLAQTATSRRERRDLR